jgi:transcriptional regulator with XRE-family HTH domain
MRTHKWADIKARSKPEVRAKAAAIKRDLEHQVRLAELRRMRGLTQQTLADAMGLPQPEVSKIERRSDLYLRTLRRFVEASGGELVLLARFPDGDVRVSFDEPVEAPE